MRMVFYKGQQCACLMYHLFVFVHMSLLPLGHYADPAARLEVSASYI